MQSGKNCAINPAIHAGHVLDLKATDLIGLDQTLLFISQS